MRAQRFGVSASGGSVVDESKLGKRAERFGLVANAPTTPVLSSDALEKRSKRFGISSDNNTAASEVNYLKTQVLKKYSSILRFKKKGFRCFNL